MGAIKNNALLLIGLSILSMSNTFVVHAAKLQTQKSIDDIQLLSLISQPEFGAAPGSFGNPISLA